MAAKVVHLARKFLPPTASFIYNQITHHNHYNPVIVYCEENDSVFKDLLIRMEYPRYLAVHGPIGRSMYQYLRTLSPADKVKLNGYLQESGAEIAHVHYGVDALVYADVLQHTKIPVLVSFYGYDCTSFPNRWRGYGKRWLQQKLFNNEGITAYTAMSPDMKDDLIKLGCPEEKIIVHYHGSDPRPFYQERKYTNKTDIRLLIVSSLTEKKGHLFLLKAFKRATTLTSQNLQLHIAGDGELKETIENFIQEKSIKNVHMHGLVAYGSEEHHQLLNKADIFVHPSITTTKGEKEGIPGALIEARSAGLPVIGTYHAGIPFIVEHGNTGMLVKEHAVEELAQHIISLAESAELREKIGRQGQEYTLRELDVVKKEKDLEEIYDRLLNGQSLIAGDKKNKVRV